MKAAFHRATGFMKTPAGITLGALLLGTTSLVTPHITSTLGTAIAASAALGLTLNVLINSSALVLKKTKLFGRALGLSSVMLGAGLGVIASIPEFATAISSIRHGTGDLGIGTIVGGNVAHIFLILGATAALGGIARARGASWKFNAAAMATATVGFGGLLATNSLNSMTGYALLAAGVLYAGAKFALARKDSTDLKIPLEDLLHDHSDHDHTGHKHDQARDHGHDHVHEQKTQHHGYKSLHRCDKDHDHASHEKPRLFPIETKPVDLPAPTPEPKPRFTLKEAGLAAIGTAGLIYSASVLPDAAVALSSITNIDKAAVGAIVLGLATSAPELSINIQAALDKDTDFVVSNILACNLAGILFVGSALALSNTPVPPTFTPDTPLGLFNLAALGTSAALMGVTLWANKGGIKKWQGFGALALYAGYIFGSYGLGSSGPEAASTPAPVYAPAAATAKIKGAEYWLSQGPGNAA